MEKIQDMSVRRRRVVGVQAPVAQARPVGFLEPAHDLPQRGESMLRPLEEPPAHKVRYATSNGILWSLAAAITVLTAVMAKELGPVSPMAAFGPLPRPQAAAPVGVPAVEAPASRDQGAIEGDASIRWYNGRPVRPARTIRMRVTAYSPDAASCYPYADGQTATLHSVDTNGGFLVAADTSLLPFGTMLSIDGYASGSVVPVLDRGGAIKGNRLDLLFPTHEEAIQWGVKTLDVVVWEYADGKPAVDPRRERS